MPQRTTLADAKNPALSGISAVLNIPPTDTRFNRYINEATQRLLAEGDWVGTIQKYKTCVANGCLTWPRQFETILAVAICERPITVRNSFFEFLENGYGLRREQDGCPTNLVPIDGNFCTFDDIRGDDKKLKVYCDIAADNTAQILFQGYDENNQWITTFVGGEWIDGEYVTPSAAGTLSTKFFSQLTGVQKPVTNGVIRVYEYDTTLTTQRALAYYESDETRPIYRRCLISGLSNVRNGADCETKTVTVLAKMSYQPVRKDTDWLLIGNLAALKLECQAIRKFENNLFQEAEAYHAEAINQLQQERKAHLGTGTVNVIRRESRNIGGPAVANII